MPIDLSVPTAVKATRPGKTASPAEGSQRGSAGPAASQRSRVTERAIARFREINSDVGPRARIMFTERLALLLETGVSLHEALKGLRVFA